MTFWKLCSHLHVNDTIWGRVSKNFSDIWKPPQNSRC
jgi:hypothetical protein